LIDEIPETLRDIKNLNFDIIKRSTLKAEYFSLGKEKKVLPFALNDVTFTHGAQARLISLNVNVNDELLSSYSADGLIFATATGSTAHSMSAGGPILYPSIEAIALTPICPHTLSNRPIILPPDCKIEVSLNNAGRDVLVAIDGQVSEELKPQDKVVIQLSNYKAHFIHSSRHSFATILREKLKWTGELKNNK
jgi:NAD+ kinase